MEAMPMPAQEASAAATRSSSQPASFTLLMSSSHGSIEIFIFAALAVLATYAHLLIISISYIKLVLIPVIMLAFIGAVACKFYSTGGRQYYANSSETGFANRVEMLVALTAVTLVPQLAQLLCSCLDKFVFVGQQQQDSFLISHFLFFFSSSIGALQVMMVTLRAAKVSQVLRMTFIVVLHMSLHAKGAEWVGEDMVLLCMPELVAALLWFFDHFDHGGYTIYIDKIISFESDVTILGAAAAAAVIFLSKFAYEGKVSTDWCTRVFVSCTLSGMFSYFSMWVFSASQHDSAKVPIQLLKLSAYICFGIPASLLLVLAMKVFDPAIETRSFIDDGKAVQIVLVVIWFLLVNVYALTAISRSKKTVVMIVIIYSFLIQWPFKLRANLATNDAVSNKQSVQA